MKLFAVALLFYSTVSYAQSPDTAKNHVPASWKKFEPAIRLGAGIQKNFYTELGLVFQKYFYEGSYGYIASAFYTTFQWTPPTKGNEKVYGVKLGAEMINNGAGGGIELTYLFNDTHTDWVITPKLGFGLGVVNLFYGYNISTNKYPFPNVRKNQFSLIINTNLFFHYLKAGNK